MIAIRGINKETVSKKIVNFAKVRIIATLALFNYIFLGTEYLFDNMMAYTSDSKGVVIAQSYVLGASVIGFILFPMIHRLLKKSTKYIMVFTGSIVSVICLFIIQQHQSYHLILMSGCVVFILLGIAGSAVHYIAASALNKDRHLSKTIGFSYALGLLLQFINNDVIDNSKMEAMVLSIVLVIWVILMIRLCTIKLDAIKPVKGKCVQHHPVAAGVYLLVSVMLMACIFATLDNVITLFHAVGSVDVGQWPRLLLALSGLTAGFLFDSKRRRYMNIIMYCVTFLSTLCVLVTESGGPILLGLIVFYLSAGFFAVFFTVGFMDLSYDMNIPELWAGMGRAANNLCAVIIGGFSLTLIELENSQIVSMIALVLYALISVTIFLYSNKLKVYKDMEEEKTLLERAKVEESADKLSRFSEAFSLTSREQDILKALLESEDSVQNIANQLFISRAGLYRHIAVLNEKTKTKSRVGLIQFYYRWNATN